MELCTAQALSNLPSQRLFTHSSNKQFQWQFSASKISPPNFHVSGLRYYTKLSVRSSMSDETSIGASPYVKNEPDGVITMEDTRPSEKKEYGESAEYKPPEEDSSEENQMQLFEILDKLEIKFDSDDTYSILLLGGGAFIALYLATAVVGAIDSVPLVPKLLEVVGLSYTLWFGTRYLVFKKNREELAAKLQEIKKQVLGSSDD